MFAVIAASVTSRIGPGTRRLNQMTPPAIHFKNRSTKLSPSRSISDFSLLDPAPVDFGRIMRWPLPQILSTSAELAAQDRGPTVDVIHHVAEDLAEWLGRLVPER